MTRKSGRPNPELAKPRVANGGGPMPTHVSYIFHDSDGRYRLQIHERARLRSRLGFHRELICADDAEFDAQLDFLVASRVPFMVGHMIPGPSDDVYFWLKAKGRPVDYLEISVGGRTDWQVREIFEGAKVWRGVKLEELLGPDIDLFAPENRPRVARPEPPAPPTAPPPDPPAAPVVPEPPPPNQPESVPPPTVVETSPPPAPAPNARPSPEPNPEAAATPPPPEGNLPPDENSAPAAGRAPEPTEPTDPPEKTGRPGRRWVEYGSALILVALIAGSFWRATGYFDRVIPFEPADILPTLAQAALAGAMVYSALCLTLFPKCFPRWTHRLELLALSLIAFVLIAFCELLIANIRYDEAPRTTIQTVVKEKTIFKGKYGRHPPEYWTWHLLVESWSDPDDERQLRVSRQTWDAVAPGDRIAFRPHPGRLGWVWYTEDELAAPDFVTVKQP